MEPVEAVRYNLPEGGEAWLSRWERQHDDKPRRATESTFDFESRASEWPQPPRRYRIVKCLIGTATAGSLR